MEEIKENRYDGFFMGTVFLIVVLAVAAFARLIGELIASWFFDMPDISNLGGSADYFFGKVYPVMFIVTTIFWFGTLAAGGRLIGKKNGYKYEIATPEKKGIFQLALAMTVYLAFSLWFTLSGEHETVSWYLSATVAKLFGIIDPQALLSGLTASEVGETFRIASVTGSFAWLFVLFYIVVFLLSGLTLRFFRKKGEAFGIKARLSDREALHSSSAHQKF